MKVVIRGVVYDSDKEPIAIAWATDKERIITGNHISDMKGSLPSDDAEKHRMYIAFPPNTNPAAFLDKVEALLKK